MASIDKFLTKEEKGIKTIRFAFQNELHLPQDGCELEPGESRGRNSKDKVCCKLIAAQQCRSSIKFSAQARVPRYSQIHSPYKMIQREGVTTVLFPNLHTSRKKMEETTNSLSLFGRSCLSNNCPHFRISISINRKGSYSANARKS